MMKNVTKQFKKEIQLFDTVEERLKHLKDRYKGQTAYIVTCGPSLSKHDVAQLRSKLSDKLVICIKQAQNLLQNETDFHLMSTYNLSPYEWNDDTIVFWQFSKSYVEGQLQKVVNLQAPIDLYIPVINPPFINRTQTTQATENFDNFYMMETDTEVMWGSGMMYETGIPLALLLGCTKIVTIAWDLGHPNKPHKHFDDDKIKRDCYPMDGEIAETLKSTIALEKWLDDKNIDFKILSDESYINQNFERITLENID
jgi:hypothetical protein